MPGGASWIGTDLSDDRPVSFVFNQALSDQRGELVSPSVRSNPFPRSRQAQSVLPVDHSKVAAARPGECRALWGSVFLFVADQMALSLDATPGTYRQRGTSSLQRLFRAHFPELVARYEAEFAKRLGRGLRSMESAPPRHLPGRGL